MPRWSWAAAQAAAAHDWNDANIAWKGFDEGLALAQKEKRPDCLIVYTEWCPHCQQYAKVFHDPAVVEKAKRLVMVHVDQDKDKSLAQKYVPDGSYIPRTMFLAPDGTLATDVHAPRTQYVYFFDEKDPAAVLGGMDAALAKIAAPSKPSSPPTSGPGDKKP